MKTVAILQPSYLPWLGFFDQMARSDVFVFYDDVQYDKHGWRNRNWIKSLNNQAFWLTVPVLTKGCNKPRIQDVQIDNTKHWARKHIETVRQYYAKAPYVSEYLPELTKILSRQWKYLEELNLEIILWMAEKLNIHVTTVCSSKLGIEGGQTERLVKTCEYFGAGKYLSGNTARNYIDVSQFEKKGMCVEFQNYHHPEYNQLHGPFIPYLSTLDLLLNEGSNAQKFFGFNHD